MSRILPFTAAAERRPAAGRAPATHARLSRRAILAGAAGLALAAGGCAHRVTVASAVIPPPPPGRARIWIYRDYIPSDSLNMAAVSINGATAGYAQSGGGAFYRDVPPGNYRISVDSYGKDTDQSAHIDLAAGQQAYVKIESLRAWTSAGDESEIERDTFYARQVEPHLALAEMASTTYYGGS